MKFEIRDIKTSTAVFLSVLISNAVNLEYPFFTAIAAIFTMESVKDTPLNAGRIRILGSIVGALAGIVFVYIQPNNAFLCGIGMMVVITICHIFNLDKAISISGVIFMAIMLGTNIKDPLRYSVSRILNTFVGIGIAVIIDYAMPDKEKQHY